MAKVFLGEQTLAKLIGMISSEFKKYVKKTDYAGTYYDRVYAVDMKGKEQKMIDVSNSYVANSIAQRTASGALAVNTPTADEHATTKAYVDGLVGDVETALDSIIAIQTSLIGGDA